MEGSRAQAASHERRLVRFLSDRRSYPHPAGAVAHRDTHISHVFLAGRFAYKLKKPVKFSFLDASTLALRKQWCRDEFALNRRLAPWLYLGVVPISRTRRGLQFGGGGRVVEWLVKMHRLPDDRLLDRMVATRRDETGDRVGHPAAGGVGDGSVRRRSRRTDRVGHPAAGGVGEGRAPAHSAFRGRPDSGRFRSVRRRSRRTDLVAGAPALT